MKRTLFETDWIASRTVFYHEKTGKVSQNINDVIDYANLEIDPEGFNNYLDFGYSILEQTPVKYVKFLRYSSRLLIDDKGILSVEYLDDPADTWLDRIYSEEEIFDLIQSKIRAWEHTVEGEIIIPTSGGYDSRLLNSMIEEKSRIRSFTYGISEDQSESFEVVYARCLSEILGTKWEQIPLGDFHKYFDDWDRIFGVSTHAHGMYHIEFYKKMVSRVKGNNAFLSGIFGDVWAGSVFIPKLKNQKDIIKLSYSHGLCADSRQSRLSSKRPKLSQYWETNKKKLEDERLRVLATIRLKIRLISYLIIVPEQFCFKPWSPFLDIEVAMAMLNLPHERRKNRIWMKEYFQRKGLDIESGVIDASRQNVLDLSALRRIPVVPLDVDVLQEVINPAYVKWINNNVKNNNVTTNNQMVSKLLNIPKVGGILRLLGIGKNKQLEAYNAYLVLLPIEKLLKRCNKQKREMIK